MIERSATRAKAKLESTVGDVVYSECGARQDGRVAERDVRDECPQPDAFRPGSEPSEKCPGLEPRLIRVVRVYEMVGQPHRVEAETFNVPPALHQHGPGGVLHGDEPKA